MITNVLEYIERCADQEVKGQVSFFTDDRERVLYSEMVESARRVGSMLLDEKLSRQPIAVYLPKSIMELKCFWGIVYSGNFYVPIDYEQPVDRIKKIFDTLNPKVIICSNDMAGEAKKLFSAYHVLYAEELLAGEINKNQLLKVREKSIDTDPVYALYTSGSTGKPKGVVVSHRSIISYAESVVDTFHMSQNSILGNQTPFYFSMSVLDIYATICCGGSLCLIPKKLFMFPIELVDYLNSNKINTIYWVPTALSMLNRFHVLGKIKLPYLKKVLFAGEVLPTKYVNEWRKYFPDIMYANLFGPTEITDIGTYYVLDRQLSDDEAIPIGKNCKNVDTIVISDTGKLVDLPEIEGELCFRGSFLALGYYNDWDKTGGAYIQNPFNNEFPELIYKTGDIVKYNQFGELLYVGRKDNQIKHMGNRIELGEIESNILLLQEVQICACILDVVRDRIICYYEGTIGIDEIKNYCKSKLPQYMIPNNFVKVDAIPLNANGKIDRRKLAEYEK